MKEIMNQFKDDIKKEFISTYMKELDDNILKMIVHFGFKNENLNELNEWLINEDYDLLMDNEEKDGNSYKSIYLLDKSLNKIVGVFAVEIFTNEEDIGYRFSDIFVCNID